MRRAGRAAPNPSIGAAEAPPLGRSVTRTLPLNAAQRAELARIARPLFRRPLACFAGLAYLGVIIGAGVVLVRTSAISQGMLLFASVVGGVWLLVLSVGLYVLEVGRRAARRDLIGGVLCEQRAGVRCAVEWGDHDGSPTRTYRLQDENGVELHAGDRRLQRRVRELHGTQAQLLREGRSAELGLTVGYAPESRHVLYLRDSDGRQFYGLPDTAAEPGADVGTDD